MITYQVIAKGTEKKPCQVDIRI